MPKAKGTLRKKNTKKSKTLVALERVEDILDHTSKATPSRWKRWLGRYDFIPRKYIALMIFGAFVTVLRNRHARSTIFSVLAYYFPSWEHSLGRTQQAVGIATSYGSGEKLNVQKELRNAPFTYVTTLAKSYAGDPESRVILEDGKQIAKSIVQTIYEFTKLPLDECSNLAVGAARRLIRNEGMLKLVDMDLFDPVFRPKAEAYIPSDTNHMSDALKHDARQFWLIKMCDAQAVVNLNHAGKPGINAKNALNFITNVLQTLP